MARTNQPAALERQTTRIVRISAEFMESVAADWIRERSREEYEDASAWSQQALSKTAQNRSKSLGAAAAAVNVVFLSALRRLEKTGGSGGSSKSSSVQEIAAHLSANDIVAIQKSLRQASESKRDAAERDRYLYRLLLKLNNENLLTFTLPAFAEEKPPRTLAFDALNPNLPPAGLFRIWQRAIADFALDARRAAPPSSGGEKKNARDLEFGAVAALLAFGGACSGGDYSAIKTLASLRISDFTLAENKLHLRDCAEEQLFELTLHPVQTLALAHYCRRKIFGDGKSKDADGALFSLLSGTGGISRFRNWLDRFLKRASEIHSEDFSGGSYFTENSKANRAAMLLAGAHRWMLDIYPVYLVSILAGKFDAPRTFKAQSGSRSRTAENLETVSRSIPVSAREKSARHQIADSLKTILATDSGKFSSQNVETLVSRWRQIQAE